MSRAWTSVTPLDIGPNKALRSMPTSCCVRVTTHFHVCESRLRTPESFRSANVVTGGAIDDYPDVFTLAQPLGEQFLFQRDLAFRWYFLQEFAGQEVNPCIYI